MITPTTISIVDVELLSDLLENSWQYKLSSDVIKIMELGFVQKIIYSRSKIKKTHWGIT